MSTMNDIIRERRKALGLTQKELADMLSISDKTVSRWESSNQMPDAILLPDLAEALKISITELYGLKPDGTGEEASPPKSTYPKAKQWVLTCYKSTMIIGLIFFIFGAMLLIHVNAIYLFQGESRGYGNVFVYIGAGSCLACEIAYIILYSSNRSFTPVYLSEDIKYSGLVALCISAVLMVVFPIFTTVSITYIYELITVSFIIVAEILMLFQKRKLKAAGVSIGRKITLISVAIMSVCVAIMFGVFVYFTFLYSEDSILATELVYAKKHGAYMLEAKIMIYSYMLLGLPMISSLLMNYIQLLIKSKKLS